MNLKKIIYVLVGQLLIGCSSNTDLQTSSLQSSSSLKTTVSDKGQQNSRQALKEPKKQLKEEQQKHNEVKKPTYDTEDKKQQQKIKEKEASLKNVKPKDPKEKNPESNTSASYGKKDDKQTVKTTDETKPSLPNVSPKSKKEEQPLIFPEFFAPEKFEHPLRHSNNLTFMIGEDSQGSYLYGEGPIISGAYEKFLKYVNHYEARGIKLNRLMLHSPGGVLDEGINIGEYILKNKWTTDADMYMRCYSTCGFIYAAGIEKRIQTGAEVGFHRPYLPQVMDTPEFIDQVYDKYQSYWRAVGGSQGLYDTFMREYGREDMYILNSKNIHEHMHVEKY